MWNQCDHISALFVQYSAIYNNENLPNNINIYESRLNILPSTKLTSINSKRLLIFCKSGEILLNLVTLKCPFISVLFPLSIFSVSFLIGHSRPLYPYFCTFQYSWYWINVLDKKSQKQPLCQLSHNHCPLHFRFLQHFVVQQLLLHLPTLFLTTSLSFAQEQCDQIWRNVATLAKFSKSFTNFWQFFSYLAKCWAYYFGKFGIFFVYFSL